MRLKKSLLIAAFFLIGLIVSIYLILLFYDFNKFKPRIIQAAREATGRELILGGDIKFDVGLAPGISFEDVAFQNAPWGSRTDMARAERLEVQLAIWPLIWGNIKVKRFVLEAPDILLEINESGDTNFGFQTSEKPKKQDTKAPGLIFNEVVVKNGRLTYKDNRSKSSYTLIIDRFNAAASGKKMPLTVDFQGAFNKKRFAVEGTFDEIFRSIETGEPLTIQLTAKTKDTTVKIDGRVRDPFNTREVDGNLTLAGKSIIDILEFAGVPAVPDMGPYRLTAHLSGSSDRLTIDKMNLTLGSEDRLQATLNGSIKDLLAFRGIQLNFSFRSKGIAALETLFDQPLPLKGAFALSGHLNDPAPGVLRFYDLVADLGDNNIFGTVDVDHAGQQVRWTARLASRKLDLRSVKLPADVGVIDTRSLADLGPFTLFVNAGGPLAQLSLEKIELQAGNENLAKFSLQGRVQDLTAQRGLELNFLIQGENVANLEKLLGRPVPIKGAFKASGQMVVVAEKTYRFNSLNIRLNDSDIGGALDINLAGPRPRINASLVSAKINLKSIMANADQPAARGLKPDGAKKDSTKTSPGAPAFLKTLKAVDMHMKFIAQQLLLPELRINHMTLDTRLHNGDFMINAQGTSLPDFSQLTGLTGLTGLGPYNISARAREVDGRLSLVELNLRAGREEMAEISVTAAAEDLMALRGVKGRFTLRAKDIAEFTRLLGQPLPLRDSFSLSGSLSVPVIHSYRLRNLKMLAGQNDISGRLDLDLTGKRPRLHASLWSKKLDLRPLLKTADDQHPETQKNRILPGTGNKAPAQKPLLLNILTRVDIEFNVRSENLLVPNLLISNLNCNLNLQNGQYLVTADTRATPGIGQLMGIADLAELGPSNLIFKGVATADKLTVERLDYHAGTQEFIEIRLNGSAQDLLTWRGVTSSFRISGNDATRLEIFTKDPVPYKGPFSLSGRLSDPSHRIYNFDRVRIVMGDSDLAGWSKIDFTRERPRVEAELTSRRLDLAWLFPGADSKDKPAKPTTKAANKDKKIFPHTRLPLDTLKLADLDVAIKAEEIVIPRLTLRDFTAGIVLDDRQLAVTPFQFSAGKGSVKGALNMRIEGIALALETEMDIDQIYLASRSGSFDASRTLEGTIDAKIKISGRGDSIATLMADLNGTVTFIHRGGQIANRFFDMIFGDLTTELVKRINMFSQKQRYTEIKCYVSHFDITDGLAKHAFVLDTSQSTMSGAGRLNLKTETLDVGFKTSPKKGVKIPGLGKVGLSLGELTKPFKIGGTFANPALVVDPARTAVTFGKVIGGLTFGPAGLAVVFGDISSKKIDPCRKALEAIRAPQSKGDPTGKIKIKKERWWQK